MPLLGVTTSPFKLRIITRILRDFSKYTRNTKSQFIQSLEPILGKSHLGITSSILRGKSTEKEEEEEATATAFEGGESKHTRKNKTIYTNSRSTASAAVTGININMNVDININIDI